MHFYGATLADGIDLLVGLPLEIHPRGFDLEQRREGGSKLGLPRADLRTFENDRGIEIPDLEPHRPHSIAGFAQEDPRVRTFPSGIGVGEELSDVVEAEGAEQRIRHGMEEGIPVGVADWPAIVIEMEASEHESPALAGRWSRFEAMKVVSVSDAKSRIRHGMDSSRVVVAGVSS